MNDKELLKKLKTLLEQTQKNQKNTDEHDGKNKKNATTTYGGKVKNLGTHPGAGVFFKYEDDKQKGYSSVLMLSFITLFCQLLFMLIAYLIYK